jgi:SAM-dependent MidA family methyltransferase
MSEPYSLSAEAISAGLRALVDEALAERGGWLPFDQFMHLALYAPGLGYYANAGTKFGWWPGSGSDFVTAPELSPLFGRALAAQVAQALRESGTDTVIEFGAGSGALAGSVLAELQRLGQAPAQYLIVDVSGHLRARQAERLAAFGDTVRWLDHLPEALEGVVIGNEVLDAMPVQLLAFDGQQWRERGVVRARADQPGPWAWDDQPTHLHPPVESRFVPGTVTEVHPQAEAFIATLARALVRGAAFFIDYGFPEAEYYHPQRTRGTLMCHRGHRSDDDPLGDVGLKDITAHVNFTGVALAGQEAGLDVAGYTSQGRFLLNCGIAPMLAEADVRERSAALKLVNEHEMGELFKVLAFTRGCSFTPLGFASGDRTHTL